MILYLYLGIGFIVGLIVGLNAPSIPDGHFDCDEKYHRMREKLCKEIEMYKAEIQRLVNGQ